MRKHIIALDTSNYTTSLALMDTEGELILNLKRPLRVKAGECGLRQSDAVFMHTVNIPDLMRELNEKIGELNPVCVAVSDKPRNLEGSYMPCFLAGVSAASAISAVNGLPLYRFSHQCGHIMAAIYSSSAPVLSCERFAAFHLSGGTSEFVSVMPEKYGFKTELLGGTKDLNAGQIIDRIGVVLGMPFPAGPHLERAALAYRGKIPSKKVSSSSVSLLEALIRSLSSRMPLMPSENNRSQTGTL